jgi:hypothetical protein
LAVFIAGRWQKICERRRSGLVVGKIEAWMSADRGGFADAKVRKGRMSTWAR